MFGYFSGISFPYPNMQQLNLDWIMKRVGEVPTCIQLPAISVYGDIITIIDDNADIIPVGVSLLVFGNPLTDGCGKCAYIMCTKQKADYYAVLGMYGYGGFVRGSRQGTATALVSTPPPVPAP